MPGLAAGAGLAAAPGGGDDGVFATGGVLPGLESRVPPAAIAGALPTVPPAGICMAAAIAFETLLAVDWRGDNKVPGGVDG